MQSVVAICRKYEADAIYHLEHLWMKSLTEYQSIVGSFVYKTTYIAQLRASHSIKLPSKLQDINQKFFKQVCKSLFSYNRSLQQLLIYKTEQNPTSNLTISTMLTSKLLLLSATFFFAHQVHGAATPSLPSSEIWVTLSKDPLTGRLAVREAGPDASALADGSELVRLDKRQCSGTCSCRPGTDPGLYCWSCDAVRSCTGPHSAKGGAGTCGPNHIFQCSSSGACCSYGYRASCVRGTPCNG